MSLSPKGELLSVAWDDTISYTASAFEVTGKPYLCSFEFRTPFSLVFSVSNVFLFAMPSFGCVPA